MEKYVDVHAHLNEFADYENFLNKNKNETLMLKTRKIHKSKVF